MARYPKIQSPCPYRGDLSAIMDGDICRLCRKPVVDLDALEDQARQAVLAGCGEPVCVSYRLPAALAAAALAASALGAPTLAAAQSASAAAAAPDVEIVEDLVIVGGITDPKTVEYHDAEPDAGAELPVVYEAETPDQPALEPAKS